MANLLNLDVNSLPEGHVREAFLTIEQYLTKLLANTVLSEDMKSQVFEGSISNAEGLVLLQTKGKVYGTHGFSQFISSGGSFWEPMRANSIVYFDFSSSETAVGIRSASSTPTKYRVVVFYKGVR